MSRLASFMRQRWAVRAALLRSWWLLLEARLRLSLRPFPEVQAWGEPRLAPPRPNLALSVPEAMWCLEVMAGYVPNATCLVKALAGRRLLARQGRAAQLKIGVALDEAGELTAHAWLERGGEVILGDLTDLGRFRPLSAGDEAKPAGGASL